MSSSHRIRQLCETWWVQLADSTRDQQHQFAEKFLEVLSWHEAAPIALPGPAMTWASASYLLRAGSEDSIAAHFVRPGALEAPSSVTERGLDFCPATRTLVATTRAFNVHYAFITDLYRSYLYDARTDELLLGSDTPAGFDDGFSGVLSREDIERGSLGELRREPRSITARRLRDWEQTWCKRLMAEGRVAEDAAGLTIDRLILLRYLLDHDILRRPGWRLHRRFNELMATVAASESAGCGHALVGLFHDIWLDWGADLFEPENALDAALENDAVVAALLREFSLLSRIKFQIATILESFNYGDASEKARVRMIPEEDEERNAQLHKVHFDTVDAFRIALDLTDEGYRAIFMWFDRLIDVYERVNREFDAKLARERAQNPPGTAGDDLFAWSTVEEQRPRACADPLPYAIEQGMRLYYTTPRQLRIGRLMLYLHLISRYHESKVRFVRFPPVCAALEERPNLLEKDRRQIYSPVQWRDEDNWGVG
jgi:hypothetical protein